MSDAQITIKVMELPDGGFVIGQDSGDDFTPMRAVSTIDEVSGCVQRWLQEWNTNARILRQREREDEEPKVIRPSRFWPKLFARIDERTGT